MGLFRKPEKVREKGRLAEMLSRGILTPEDISEVMAVVQQYGSAAKAVIYGKPLRKIGEKQDVIIPEYDDYRSRQFDSLASSSGKNMLAMVRFYFELEKPIGPSQFGIYCFPSIFSDEEVLQYIKSHKEHEAVENIRKRGIATLAIGKNIDSAESECNIFVNGVNIRYELAALAPLLADPAFFLKARNKINILVRQLDIPPKMGYTVFLGDAFKPVDESTRDYMLEPGSFTINIYAKDSEQVEFFKRNAPIAAERRKAFIIHRNENKREKEKEKKAGTKF